MTSLNYPVMAKSQGAIHLSVFASFFSRFSSFSLQRKSKHSSKDEKSNLKKKEGRLQCVILVKGKSYSSNFPRASKH